MFKLTARAGVLTLMAGVTIFNGLSLTQPYHAQNNAPIDLPLKGSFNKTNGGAAVINLPGAVFQQKNESDPRNPKTLQMFITYEEGKWIEGVGGAAGGLNQGSHHGKLVKQSADGLTLEIAMNIGSDRWVPGDPNATYTLKITSKLGENPITGTYTGTFRGQKVSGNLNGLIALPGFADNVMGEDGFAHLQFKMGTRIMNWNHAKWAPYGFPAGTEMNGVDTIEVEVETDNPRHDAWLDLGIMERDGSWYIVRNAIPLSSKSRKVQIPLDVARHAEWVFNAAATGPGAMGNFDENGHLDLKDVTRLAFGVINGHGVGEVQAKIKSVKLLDLKAPGSVEHTVIVDGKGLVVNGQEEIPYGIFGFHIAGGSEKEAAELRPGSIRYIQAMAYGGSFFRQPKPELNVPMTVNSQYDRKQQLPQVKDANWREKTKQIGIALGNASKGTGKNGVIEWWNEPYLDLGRMLESELAKRMKPKPGTKAGDPLPAPYTKMIWAPKDKLWFWRWYGEKPKNLPEGNGELVPIDPQRFSYWSGPQIGEFYIETFNIVAKNAKQINPDIQMMGSHGFRWHEDDWISWYLLHKPLVDRTIEHLDGLGEHHYQGHNDAMTGAYEVLTTYTAVRFNKPLPSYNTETNDLLDSPARGNVAALDQGGGKFTKRKRLTYNLRGIMAVLMWTPDKLRARAIHALWRGAADNRKQIKEKISLGRRIEGHVDSFKFANTATVKDEKKTKTVKAGAGKTLLVMKLKAKSTDRKKAQRFTMSDGHLSIVQGDKKTQYKAVAFDKEGVRRDKPFVMVKTGDYQDFTIVYEIPSNAKNSIIESFIPVGREKRRIHLSGEFVELQIVPWRRMGINEGEYWCLKFLADLRGPMLDTDVTNNGAGHPKIWTSASIDVENNNYVVIAMNDTDVTRDVTFDLKAPQGNSFNNGRWEILFHNDDGKVGITSESIKVSGETFKTTIKIKPHEAAKIVLPLSKKAGDLQVVNRTQFYAGDKNDVNGGILNEIAPGETLSLPVKIDTKGKTVKRAYVRVVVELLSETDGFLVLDGNKIALPSAYTPNNAPYIRDIPIDPAALNGMNQLTFMAAGSEAGDGFRLCAASVIVETE